MKRTYLIACCALLFFCLLTDVACLHRKRHNGKNCPSWVTSIPNDRQNYYALGISGSTRVAREAYLQATQRARAELGRMIIIHVRSEGLVISTADGQYTREVIDILSDTELNFTEVVEIYYDRGGSCGPPDHHYVLVRVEKRRAENILKSIK